MSKPKPKCSEISCFQNKCASYCDLLTENPGWPCPFYKTEEEAERGRLEAHKKLVDMGRFDLINQFEYNPQRRGQW